MSDKRIPHWLPADAWNGWLEMRRAMKRVPLTERAQQIALKQLAEYHAQGYDVAAILDESTMRGWRGLFVSDRTPRKVSKGCAKLSARDLDYYTNFYKEHPELKPEDWPV